ncbi:MAG TPA: hypothetical protein VE263_13275 [Candidatus Angelobacter sp.]|nr:hypothetical protein [Candidatus Angelobacter sp.]
MIRRLLVLALFSMIAISGSTSVRQMPSPNQESCAQDYRVWVTQALEKMETIKAGMTREQLLKIFTTEGGLSAGLRRTYVSRDCPYFKVDVEFEAVGRPNRDEDGRVTLVEDSRDIIVRVSRPYLQFSITD